MWVIMSDSMLSIVRKHPSDRLLTVRARAKGDIERIFPDAKVQVGGGTDYMYRAKIPAKKVADAMAREVMGIRYSNFKSSVMDQHRHDVYFGVWRALMPLQYPPSKDRTGYLFGVDDDHLF